MYTRAFDLALADLVTVTECLIYGFSVDIHVSSVLVDDSVVSCLLVTGQRESA